MHAPVLVLNDSLKRDSGSKVQHANIHASKDLKKEDKAEDHHLKRYKSNSDAINEDIIFEILTRLHVASLLRCKAVCKSWYILISDPCFVAAHLDRSRKKRKLAILPVIPKPWILKIYGYEEQDKCFPSCIFQKKLPDKRGTILTRVHGSNGLILVNTEDESFVCNPSTGDFTVLPEGGRDSSRFLLMRSGFGSVPGTNVVKVAQYFYRSYNPEGGTYSLGFEVFTLGVDSSWRVMAKDPPYPIEAWFHAISASGAIYFKIDNALHTASPEFALSFDLKDEKFIVIPPPFPLSSVEHPNITCTLIGLEDTLCFVYRPYLSEEFNIWLYKEHTWIHSFTFQLPKAKFCYTPIAVRGKKLLFRLYDGDVKLELFDAESNSFESVAHITGDADFNDRGVAFHFLRVFSYVESLEPVRPMKKIEV